MPDNRQQKLKINFSMTGVNLTNISPAYFSYESSFKAEKCAGKMLTFKLKQIDLS